MPAKLLRSVLVFTLLVIAACGGGSGTPGNETPPPPVNPPQQMNSKQMGGAIQNALTTLAGSVSTVAGAIPASVDATGSAARFKSPIAVAMDVNNAYVLDSDDHTVRKVDLASGAVTTLAGSAGLSGSGDGTGSVARFNAPQAIAIDGSSLYIADTDNHTIRKVVIGTGEVSTLAGTAGVAGSSNGTGAAARFKAPSGIASDGTNLYVSDTGNGTIRKVVIATGAVTTLAGTPGTISFMNGVGAGAFFNNPTGLATDGTILLVADNHCIRKIVIATATVTTLAGTPGSSGSSDGTGGAAQFKNCTGLALAGSALYVADSDNHTLRSVNTVTGAVTTLAGTAGYYGPDNNIGAAARFYSPRGVACDGTYVYVVESGNRDLRKYYIGARLVATVAGYSPIGSNDGAGVQARFAAPRNVTTDGTNLYIADSANGTIRKMVIATGEVTTLAGLAGTTGSSDGTGTAARFNNPMGITTDGSNLYVCDTDNNLIRRIVISTGAVTTLAGIAGTTGSANGVGTAARFYSPRGITTDGTSLYIVDYYNNRIRKVVISSATVSTLAGTGTLGSSDGPGSTATFKYPEHITTDGTSLYTNDLFNYVVRKIDIATGDVTTLAGTAGASGYVDATGAAARFGVTGAVTTDGTNLYIADNYMIRKVVLATGAVTTLTGSAGTSGYTDAVGTNDRFTRIPGGITTDGTRLFIADTDNYTIRTVQ